MKQFLKEIAATDNSCNNGILGIGKDNNIIIIIIAILILCTCGNQGLTMGASTCGRRGRGRRRRRRGNLFLLVIIAAILLGNNSARNINTNVINVDTDGNGVDDLVDL